MYAYITAFKATALAIPDASDPELLHSFIWGLRDRVRQEVRFRDPKTLNEAFRLALDVDERLF